jgi:two-component system chemotaxis response regulator CheB
MSAQKPPSLARRGVQAIAIGASAGGIDALFTLLQGLPSSLPVPVLVVLHLPPGHESRLPEIFNARLRLRAVEASPGDTLSPGTIYFAPADYHLLVEPDHTLSLSCEPPVHYSRPAIDLLFESAAAAYGRALLAIVRERGGFAVVQDPAQALHATMPRAALELAGADLVLPLAAIHDLLSTLIRP